MHTPQPTTEKDERRKIFRAAFFPFVIGVLIVLCFVLEKGMGWDFRQGGVFPRNITSLWSIFTMPFIHSDWKHLLNNVFTFFILGSTLYYFYNQIASKVLFLCCVFSGALLWVIGRDSWHIGASGVVYSLAFFLFFSGVIRKHVPLIAISLVVVFLYGSMVWHLFPWHPHDIVSWEGHLAGGITGTILSVVYRKQGPQPPIPSWEEEEEECENEEMRECKKQRSLIFSFSHFLIFFKYIWIINIKILIFVAFL